MRVFLFTKGMRCRTKTLNHIRTKQKNTGLEQQKNSSPFHFLTFIKKIIYSFLFL